MRRLKQKERLVAEVTPEGEVTAEGHVLGRLDGFRFTPDAAARGDEAKTLKAASTEGLAAEFSRRADRFYNAPDTEIDLTEQGGLMWGEHAVGKLVKGADPLAPGVEGFVDEIAGEDAKVKVERRLSHWINRRIAAQFEPLVKLRDDEAVTGLARGVAFRLVENLGVVPRTGEMSSDVKSLDQDGRGMLRKHGVRFGQHTVFMPLLLKPAPTRLRIALWALWEGLDDFPSPPPPGLVTIPALPGAPGGFYPRAGYRLAGARALRIDMLERLADMIRGQDSRGGFEATADMLSITGCTLEQFADLMKGLGYKAERGERPKPAVEAAPAKAPPAESGEAGAEPSAEATGGDAVAEAEAAPESRPEAEGATPEVSVEATPEATAPDDPNDAGADAAAAPVEALEDTAAADAPVEAPIEAQPETAAEDAAAEAPATDAPAVSSAPEAADETAAAEETPTTEAAPSPGAAEKKAEAAEGEELQVFYTFTWAPRPRHARGGGGGRGEPGGGRRDGEGRGPRRAEDGQGKGSRRGGKPGEGGKGRGGKPSGKPGGKGPKRDEPPRRYASGPSKPRKEKEIDPDNPFAALMALKSKD